MTPMYWLELPKRNAELRIALEASRASTALRACVSAARFSEFQSIPGLAVVRVEMTAGRRAKLVHLTGSGRVFAQCHDLRSNRSSPRLSGAGKRRA